MTHTWTAVKIGKGVAPNHAVAADACNRSGALAVMIQDL